MRCGADDMHGKSWTLLMRHSLFAALTLVARIAWSQGEPIGAEFRVNTYTTDNQFWPHVAADASGNFVVVWTSGFFPALNPEVMAQRFASSGAPLGPEFRVNTFTATGQYTGDVASDAAGNF